MKTFLRCVGAGVVLGLFLSWGCGSGVTTCDSSTCGGCCGSDGICYQGTEVSRCGAQGNACMVCAASNECTSEGVCTAVSTPGFVCSDPMIQCGSVCVDIQTSKAHCGRCNKTCASNQTCSSGSCVGPSAQDAGVRDGGTNDAGTQDAGVRDAGVVDAGIRDAGVVDAGSPGGDGVAYSIAECNGAGRVDYYGGGVTTQQFNVVSVLIYASDPILGPRTFQVFGYTGRSQITSSRLPATGFMNEQQIKLSIVSGANGVGVGQHQGLLALSRWDAANSRWSNAATSDTAIVTITRFGLDSAAYTDGHYCAGIMEGTVTSLVSGSGATRLDFAFTAPLLTPSFPR